jgi:hypothetical protein
VANSSVSSLKKHTILVADSPRITGRNFFVPGTTPGRVVTNDCPCALAARCTASWRAGIPLGRQVSVNTFEEVASEVLRWSSTYCCWLTAVTITSAYGLRETSASSRYSQPALPNSCCVGIDRSVLGFVLRYQRSRAFAELVDSSQSANRSATTDLA